MNKIVHEHLRASDLPEKLRGSIAASATVTVTIQEEAGSSRPSRDYLKKLLDDARRDAPGISNEEAVARIRKLRDEWDD